MCPLPGSVQHWKPNWHFRPNLRKELNFYLVCPILRFLTVAQGLPRTFLVAEVAVMQVFEVQLHLPFEGYFQTNALYPLARPRVLFPQPVHVPLARKYMIVLVILSKNQCCVESYPLHCVFWGRNRYYSTITKRERPKRKETVSPTVKDMRAVSRNQKHWHVTGEPDRAKKQLTSIGAWIQTNKRL